MRFLLVAAVKDLRRRLCGSGRARRLDRHPAAARRLAQFRRRRRRRRRRARTVLVADRGRHVRQRPARARRVGQRDSMDLEQVELDEGRRQHRRRARRRRCSSCPKGFQDAVLDETAGGARARHESRRSSILPGIVEEVARDRRRGRVLRAAASSGRRCATIAGGRGRVRRRTPTWPSISVEINQQHRAAAERPRPAGDRADGRDRESPSEPETIAQFRAAVPARHAASCRSCSSPSAMSARRLGGAAAGHAAPRADARRSRRTALLAGKLARAAPCLHGRHRRRRAHRRRPVVRRRVVPPSRRRSSGARLPAARCSRLLTLLQHVRRRASARADMLSSD